jgi:hypothetical protein
VSPRRSCALGLCLLLLSAAGCAVGERLLTSRGDYALYRETQVAEKELERLRAGHLYLQKYPDGRYHAEVASWFGPAEARFVKRAHDHLSMLRGYLKALPDGPRAAQVRDRLAELEIHQGYLRRDAERERRKLARVTKDLSEATRSRQSFVSTVSELVTRLSTLRAFGLPIARAEPAILREFKDHHGALQCAPERCHKTFVLDYFVPASSRYVSRVVEIELTIELDRGRTRSAELGGPEFFSRLGEAVDRRALVETSLAERVEAIARAVQVVENALESPLPAARCEREAVAPSVLVRDCRGVRVEMRAGVETPPRDVIVVTPSRLPPMP